MRCRHGNRETMRAKAYDAPTTAPTFRVKAAGVGSLRLVQVKVNRCLDCHAWLSLGPASPPPPEEIEAATILADVYANVEHITDWQIAIGMAAYDADNDPPTGGLAWMWHAGWLARHVWKESERG